MNTEQLMAEIGDSYLSLNIPDVENRDCQRDITRILRIASQADTTTVNQLLCDRNWRGRFPGVVLAIRKGAAAFAPTMVDSLADPRGLAIVPTCAALVIGLANQAPELWTPRLSELDRSSFSGDLGWSLDKLVFHLGWSNRNPGGFSPNDGKDFESNVRMFRWIAAYSE